MFFVVVILSLVGTTLTSSLRRGGHNALLINCPTCEHHVCDFHNLTQCEVCKIYIPHENQPPVDVRCVPAGHCHEYRHNRCCDNEGCVAQAFGHYHLTSDNMTATTESATSTTTVRTANTSSQTNPTNAGGHQTNQTNQLLNHIPCPICTHHKCDVTNTDLCEVCQISFEHQLPRDTNCLTVDHHCKDDDHHLCCTDTACVENVFGNIPKSGASLNGNKMYCPKCTIHGCNFISCETCVYHGFVYGTQLHNFKTCGLKGECSYIDAICCHDYHCIDKLFGANFQSTLPTIQSTTNASITSKTTDRASTTKAHALSHATTNASTTSTAATMTTAVGQRTTQDTTTPNIATSVSSNGQPTHHVFSAASSRYRTSTTRQQSTAPPTTTSSTIETYELLTTVASTIPTTIGTTQANPTSTDGHIPCPVCTHNICDRSNTISCEVCQITFNHQPQPQNATCLNRGQCFEDDSNLCCTDLACVDVILKHLDAVTNYPLIQPEIHASIKRKTPEESNIGDLLREIGEKKN